MNNLKSKFNAHEFKLVVLNQQVHCLQEDDIIYSRPQDTLRPCIEHPAYLRVDIPDSTKK